MNSQITDKIIKYLESLEKEVLKEDGQISAPATDSSATGGTLPVPMLGKKVVRRKNLEDQENEKNS